MAPIESLVELKSNPGVRTQIGRFGVQFRRRLWSFCAASRRRLDLVHSFPAAAVAIASRLRGDPARAEAIRLVEAGAPLQAIADALSLPYWYRRLPPEAFAFPLAGGPGGLPGNAEFGARLLNLVPREPGAVPRWFQTVTAAWSAGGDEFALWIGLQGASKSHEMPRIPILALALYAYHSRDSGNEAGRVIDTPWSPCIGLGKAASEARRWLLTVLQERCVCAPPAGFDCGPTWQIAGFEIVALNSPGLIVQEARAMRNCLRQYVGLVAAGHCRLYSIRKNGMRVATMELRAMDSRRTPGLHEIRAPMNFSVTEEILHAAQAWIAMHMPMLRYEFGLQVERHSEEMFQKLVWQPYAAAMQREGRPVAAGARPSVTSILRETQGLCMFEK